MSKEIIPFNETAEVIIRLTEGSLYFVTDLYTINRIPEPLPAAGIFKGNLLDKKGGTILDTLEVVYVTDGSDSLFTEKYTIDQLQTLLNAHDADESIPLPTYWEIFFSSDGTDEAFKIFWIGPVLMSRFGTVAP